MIEIDQLRYVRLATRDLPSAVDFAERILGLQIVDRSDDAAWFRSDFRDHTLVYSKGDPADQAIGFEVYGEDAFNAALGELRDAGIEVDAGDETACSGRKARAVASFRDPGGNRFELVLRPMNSGWRFHGTRDSGITGLAGVALRAADAPACERLWTGRFNARVADWVGDAAYLGFDAAHHRLAYHPSSGGGILAVEFAVENVDLLMQASYYLQSAQVRILHGPGRRPASGQMFLTFAGPDEVAYSFVCEGEEVDVAAPRRPRQFPKTPTSFCAWGSLTDMPEFG